MWRNTSRCIFELDREELRRLPRTRILSWLAFAAVCFFWGTTAPAIRVAVRYFPPLLLSGLRFCIAGTFLVTVLALAGKAPVNWPIAIRRSIPGGISLALANALTCWGFVTVQSGQGALLLATTALWMTLIDNLWPKNRRPASLAVWIGLGVGLVGVGLLVDSPMSFGSGTLLLLLSSFTWALGSVWQSRHPSHLPPLLEPALQMIVASAGLLPLAWAFHERCSPTIPATGWLAFVFLLITGSLIGFVAFMYILRNLSPKVVGLYTYVNPIVATWAGWCWLGETVRTRFWVASAVILGSVALVRLADDRANTLQRGSAADSTLPPA
jgi:drug/metabolite transporter (DMT)-like permease